MKRNLKLKQKRADFFAGKWSLFHWETGNKKDGNQKEAGEKDAAEAKPERVMISCPKCKKMLDRERVVRKKYVCYECGACFRVKIPNRIRMVADPGSFEPWFENLPVKNPLAYEGYAEKIAEMQEKTGLDEAVTVGKAGCSERKLYWESVMHAL